MFPDPLVFDTYKEFKDYLAAYEIDSCAHYVAYAETKDFKTDSRFHFTFYFQFFIIFDYFLSIEQNSGAQHHIIAAVT